MSIYTTDGRNGNKNYGFFFISNEPLTHKNIIANEIYIDTDSNIISIYNPTADDPEKFDLQQIERDTETCLNLTCYMTFLKLKDLKGKFLMNQFEKDSVNGLGFFYFLWYHNLIKQNTNKTINMLKILINEFTENEFISFYWSLIWKLNNDFISANDSKRNPIENPDRIDFFSYIANIKISI